MANHPGGRGIPDYGTPEKVRQRLGGWNVGLQAAKTVERAEGP